MRGLFPALLCTLAISFGTVAAQAQAEPTPATVAAYDIFETPIPVANMPDNPYDPDQVNITGEFTAPSGRKITVPAFCREDQETVITPARERLKDMRLLKLYLGRDSWVGGKNISYIIDDVRLVKYDGSEVVVGDFEKSDPRWTAGVPGARIVNDIVHSGSGAFRADFPVETQANWPGINMDISGQDWRDVKALRFAFYPLTDHTLGSLGVEFYAAPDEKLQTAYSAGKTGLKLNAWNEVTWDISNIGDRKRVRPKGPGGFFVRYAPSEVGRYRYIVRRAGVDQPLLQGEFKAATSKNPGFLHIAKPRDRYASFASGKPFILIGENVCWHGPAGLGDYDLWLPHLAAAGGNYIRVWMAPCAFGIEWDKLGRYNQSRAADLDYVFALARKHGIRIMLCLDYHGFLRSTEGSFPSSPYAARNGGPCTQPNDFLTSDAARALYKKRLRYLVARYAAYDNLLSWELFNEVDIIETYKSDIVTAWHQEMARYLKSIDPYAHIVTTSTASPYGDPNLWQLPEMEYIQSHTYNAVDKGEEALMLARDHLTKFNKPFLIGEYGVNGGSGTREQDPAGQHIHDGAWAGVLSGTMGTAMTWWWDSYIEPENLYHHWTPVARFSADIPLSARPVVSENLAASFAQPQSQTTFGDIDISGKQGSWNEASFNTPQTFVVSKDGSVANIDNLARILHGVRNHPTLHNPATFEVDFARPGKFVAQFNGVSGYGGAKLKISLDGQLLLDKDFRDDSPATGEIYDYNGAYSVDIPAGKHSIKVENDGNDWLYIDYALLGYCPNTIPNYSATALQSRGNAWLWLHNRQSNWLRKVRLNVEPTPVPRTKLALKGLPDGRYTIEWWDTWTGKITSTAQAASKDGTLTLPVPGFTRDIACKIRPASR